MTVNRGNIGRGQVGPERLTQTVLLGRYCFDSFMMEPLAFQKGTTTEPAGTSLSDNVIFTGRNNFEYAFLGTCTGPFFPTLASEGGYNWLVSDALGQGVEVYFGGLKDGHPRNFKPFVTGGGGEDFFARVLLITDNASGLDAFFGVRKAAAYAATLTEYSDIAGIRVLGNSGSTDGSFSVVTNLNNAGATDYSSTTLVQTGLEDATAVELEVQGVGGRLRVFVNGVEKGGFAAYSFDSGDVVAPTLRLVQTTDTYAQAKTLAFECGLLDSRGDYTLLSVAGATT